MQMTRVKLRFQFDSGYLAKIRDNLVERSKKRFARVIDPTSDQFDATYLKAAIYDPNEAVLIDTESYPVKGND